MTKSEHIDCVAMKRRAQRKLVKALADKSAEEQVDLLRRLAARTPLWEHLTAVALPRPARAARPDKKRRSTG